MNELSFLRIKESQIPIDAYKTIVEHYTSFLKFFYGNRIVFFIEKGSQILKAVYEENNKIQEYAAEDFYNKLLCGNIDKISYINYQKPITHLYSISCIKEKYKLQDLDLKFNNKDTLIDKNFHIYLAKFDQADIKELTSIIGAIHLIADKDNKLSIKVSDKEDSKEIKGTINTGDLEKDKTIFENIRIKYFGKDVIVSGYLYRNNITFSKKQIEILDVKEINKVNIPFINFKGIFK